METNFDFGIQYDKYPMIVTNFEFSMRLVVGSVSYIGTGGEEDLEGFNISAPPQSPMLNGFLLHIFFQVVLLGLIDSYYVTC